MDFYLVQFHLLSDSINYTEPLILFDSRNNITRNGENVIPNTLQIHKLSLDFIKLQVEIGSILVNACQFLCLDEFVSLRNDRDQEVEKNDNHENDVEYPDEPKDQLQDSN